MTAPAILHIAFALAALIAVCGVVSLWQGGGGPE